MLQSDVLNAIKPSPGIIASVTNGTITTTTTYSADRNVMIRIIGQCSGNGSSVSVNGVIVYSYQTTSFSQFFETEFFVSSGQTVTIVNTLSTSLITARSIQ